MITPPPVSNWISPSDQNLTRHDLLARPREGQAFWPINFKMRRCKEQNDFLDSREISQILQKKTPHITGHVAQETRYQFTAHRINVCHTCSSIFYGKVGAAVINNNIRLSVIIMMLKCKYNKESPSRRTMLYVVDNVDGVKMNFHKLTGLKSVCRWLLSAEKCFNTRRYLDPNRPK